MYRDYLESASFLSDLGVLANTIRAIVQPDSAAR